jgi:acyl dehydratase
MQAVEGIQAVFRSVENVVAVLGQVLGPTNWLELSQDQVSAFADLTGDHQWIHVDAERAAASPFGGTIVHGYFTLALVPYFAKMLVSYEMPGARLNYGLDKVRFPAPLPVGSRLRCTATITNVSASSGGHLITTRYVMYGEKAAKPACMADTLVLQLG